MEGEESVEIDGEGEGDQLHREGRRRQRAGSDARFESTARANHHRSRPVPFLLCETGALTALARSEGVPRTRITESFCACDCGRVPVSVSAFFFLPFFFLLLSPRIVP